MRKSQTLGFTFGIDSLLHTLHEISLACEAEPMLKNLGPDRLKGLS